MSSPASTRLKNVSSSKPRPRRASSCFGSAGVGERRPGWRRRPVRVLERLRRVQLAHLARDAGRRLARRVARLRVGAGLQQHGDDVQGAVAGGLEERGLAAEVARVHVGAGGQQRLHAGQRAGVDRLVQRRLAVAALDVHLRVRGQEHPQGGAARLARGLQQRRLETTVARVHRRARRQQQLHHVGVVGIGRLVQRRLAVGPAVSRDVGLGLQQQGDVAGHAPVGGHAQRRGAVLVADVRGRARLEQGGQDLGVLLVRDRVQRGAPAVVRRVERDAGFDEEVDGLLVVPLGPLDELLTRERDVAVVELLARLGGVGRLGRARQQEAGGQRPQRVSHRSTCPRSAAGASPPAHGARMLVSGYRALRDYIVLAIPVFFALIGSGAALARVLERDYLPPDRLARRPLLRHRAAALRGVRQDRPLRRLPVPLRRRAAVRRPGDLALGVGGVLPGRRPLLLLVPPR